MTYLRILPNELLLNLSLYLNYIETILACEFLKCEQVDLWLYKIRQELGYSNDFINEYVYDKQNNITKSLLPINEKYLELKARKGVDFGTEFYQSAKILIMRASRLRDFQLANTLTMYLLTINKIDSNNEYYLDALQGTIAVGNFALTNRIINLIRTDYPYLAVDLKEAIIKGIYENGDLSLLDTFGVKNSEVETKYIIPGLAAAGNLDQLKKYTITRDDERYYAWRGQGIMTNAVYLGRKNIIDYYKLNETDVFPAQVIMSGYINLLHDITKSSHADQNRILVHLVARGYLEEIEKYRDLLIPSHTIKNIIRLVLNHNHLDVLDYIYKLHPTEVKAEIDILFSRYAIWGTVLDITLAYLYRNGLITAKQLEDIPDVVINQMKRYNNIDTVNYILQFKYQ